ncbi:AAA family ATPase [Bradyrhizobium valentinum]|uniref:AAA family ATPase n=1 Tax=Bradyrhizobium valentinum TaxID=1518501 RepID=UPI0009E6D7A9|nr:AAA family ATPase [Bradyrhizobium valentinum]
MGIEFEVPLMDGSSLKFSMEDGEAIFILGANGTGKSSLLHHFIRQHGTRAHRISAHRQMWFEDDVINVSAVQRSQIRANASNYDQDPNSRIRDPWASSRPSAVVFDLMDSENLRAREITAAMDRRDVDKATKLSEKAGPLQRVNDLFRVANLPIQLEFAAGSQVRASRQGSPHFSISRLSDGERNALLIASDVLTAKPGTILIIDEPERHLHRSISSPLLSGLFAERPDCLFVVSSHDVTLASEYSHSKMLLLRDCKYNGSVRWDANLLPPKEMIDDQLRLDILGARKKVLFVEGDPHSLDKGLYALVFPNVSVIAKGPSRSIQHAVSAIRASYDLHWLCPFGLVDNDNRTVEEIASLETEFIYSLPHYSVESIYYHSEVQGRVASRTGALTGANALELFSSARAAAFEALRGQGRRLSERAILLKLRAQVMQQLPRSADIQQGTPVNISIDTSAAVAAEAARFDSLLASSNLEELIRRYPVRETAALSNIAKQLGFQSRSQYESAVRKLLIDDADALAFVRGLFGELPRDLDSA